MHNILGLEKYVRHLDWVSLHIAIVEHDFKLGKPVAEVMRIMGSALLVKDTIQEHFELLAREQATYSGLYPPTYPGLM
jgi:hypothetical protein